MFLGCINICEEAIHVKVDTSFLKQRGEPNYYEYRIQCYSSVIFSL